MAFFNSAVDVLQTLVVALGAGLGIWGVINLMEGYRLKGVLPMADNKQHDTRTARRPDCVTEIRMGNSVLVVSGYFKKDTTTTAADKMARVLEAEAAATQKPAI